MNDENTGGGGEAEGTGWTDSTRVQRTNGGVLDRERNPDLITLVGRPAEAHAAWNEGGTRIPAPSSCAKYQTAGGQFGFHFVLAEGGAGHIHLNVGRAPMLGPMVRGSRAFELPPAPIAPRTYEGVDLTIGHNPILLPPVIASAARS
jgi:hypothetical protein